MPLYPPETISIRLDEVSGIHNRDRNRLRKLIIDVFVRENPGLGKKPFSSEYKYFVETTLQGPRIFLKRPASLNKGFDFTICVENGTFGGRMPDTPRHEDILLDLKNKCAQFPERITALLVAIEEIYRCYDPNQVLERYPDLTLAFTDGLPLDLVFKVIKWFFIEQDITYWNWSGRAMFFDEVKARITPP